MPGLPVEIYDRIQNREARARSPLGIIVMRSGPTEISHDPVAEILRDVAVETRDRFGGCAMIPRDGLAPLLGVELSRDRGRADDVAEQHRQMPPLTDHLSRLNR